MCLKAVCKNIDEIYSRKRLGKVKNDVPRLIEAIDAEIYRRNYEARGWRGWVNPRRQYPDNVTNDSNQTIFSPGAKKHFLL